MAASCKRHDGSTTDGYVNQLPLDPIMKELLENQGGAGRHKCVYCAYERGWADAVSFMREKIGECADKYETG